MITIEMIAPFKGLTPGQIVDREDEQAEWLCSRQYARIVTLQEEASEPAAGDAFDAPAPKKRGKK